MGLSSESNQFSLYSLYILLFKIYFNTECGRKNTPIWEGYSFGLGVRTVVESTSSNSSVRAVFSVYHGVVGRISSLYC